ncbi:MAG: fluoride efflux transporter CrcB [Myxococcota bacterium]|nr:fluoride efflux transporter CrcB [Myxococcota bacterium]
MERFLIVCGAGAAGCGARYLVSLWAAKRIGTGFPYGTLIVNIVGSFAIAFVLELATRIASFPPNLRLALTTGFLGGLTTYSAFNYETTALVTGGTALRGLLNIGITLIGCLVAGFLGLLLARRFA